MKNSVFIEFAGKNFLFTIVSGLLLAGQFCGFMPKAFAQEVKKPKIAYFITRQENDIFYGPVVKFARKVAKDVGVELKVYEAKNDHIKLVEMVKEAAKEKPDAFVVVEFKDRGPEIVRIAQEAGIPIMFENSGVVSSEIGKPREKFKCYLGEMLPDDSGAGYKLAKELLKNARPGDDGKVHMIGIEGQNTMGSSIERVNGLRKAVGENKEVVLHQVVAGGWEPEKAKYQAKGLKQRYGDTSIMWTASDGMAMGVVDAIRELGLKPGVDVLTGGVDWTKEGIDSVKKGEMTASVGGHVFEAGWVLIVLFDYFNGIDFAPSEGTSLRCEMAVINKENAPQIEKALSPENWDKINFKDFSKFYNKSLKKYDFSLDHLIAEIH